MRTAGVTLLALLSVLDCVPASPRAGARSRQTGTFADARLTESSGVVRSRTHPGWLWTLNDSGNDPLLFLTDTSGRALGAFLVRGAVNIDWEAIGRAPCGTQECLLIGDIGDNGETRDAITLYRVPEPAEPAPMGITATAEALTVRYPGGPQDAEALYVEPTGSVVIMTKGRRGGIQVFRVPSSGWGRRGGVTAIREDSLPIPATMVGGRVVTDAAISPDARWVAIRTYREVWFFARNPEGQLRPETSRPVCDIAGLDPQGEGIDWWDGDTLLLTSERGLYPAGTIVLVRCPLR